MSSSRDRQVLQARELDRLSTVMIDSGVKFVKSNPIKVGAYMIGILICLFFNGFSVPVERQIAYEKVLEKINYDRLYNSADKYYAARREYEMSRGWFFTCNKDCQYLKKVSDIAYTEYNEELKNEKALTAEAKSHLGLFSKYGVDETRGMFWNQFAKGRGFAQRQSKWDALFLGMRAIGRNESMIEYLLHVLSNFLMNFTLGIFMAVVAFIFNIYSIISSFQAPLTQALPFFLLASLSAIAFALTWLIGLYTAAAGTVYVGLKFAASTARLEDGRQGARVRYRND